MHRLLLAIALLLPAPASSRPGWAGEIVKAHNDVRKRVRVPPLKWSDQLAKQAQTWADHLASKNLFAHSQDTPFGENLFAITGARASAEKVVKAWADESRHYDYPSNRCEKDQCGHYTQIVWRGTTEVGCAAARKGKREVWVCEYNPPGNYVGQRPY
jgi:uncharacterized protein YkwD